MSFKNVRIGVRLALGFGVVFILLVLVGIVGILETRSLSAITSELYQHPYAVNIEVRNIRADVFLMERIVRDLVLSNSESEENAYVAKLDGLEAEVSQSFATVSERFLGNPNEVVLARKAFDDWKPIRERVVSFALQNRDQEAISVISKQGNSAIALLDDRLDGLTSFATEKANGFYDQARETGNRAKIALLLLVAAAILGSGFASYLILQGVRRPIKAIVRKVRDIASGDISVDIGDFGGDEIGELAESLKSMQSSLIEKAEVASAIAVGNFDRRASLQGPKDRVALSINKIADNFTTIVSLARRLSEGDYSMAIVPLSDRDQVGTSLNAMLTVMQRTIRQLNQIAAGDYSVDYVLRSDHDQLGGSIKQMLEALRTISSENDRSNWIKSGLNELNSRLSGDRSIEDFSREAITYLAKYLSAPVASFYHVEEGGKSLRLVSAYAFSRRKALGDVVGIGEGILGEAAYEKELITVTGVPPDYLRVSSSLGDAVPTAVTAVPLLHEGELRGAVEIGTLRELDDREIEFLKSAAAVIATGLDSAESRDEMKHLLEETREQAEKLQVQQEELRQTNEELEEQTRALRSSEEKLQVQQEELRVANEELVGRSTTLEAQRDAIKKKNDDLEAARAEIEKKAKELEAVSDYKSEFLANMSHELRTPLNSILILSQLLGESRDGALTDKQREYAKTINGSGSDLLNLINDILDLSKVEAGKMVVNPERISIGELFEDLAGVFKPVANHLGLNFRFSTDEGMPESFVSDPQRVRQILKNLLSNAFKFTHEGSVTVKAGRPAPGTRFYLHSLDPARTIAFSVEDSGIGIPVDKRTAIFEAFHQADGTTSRKYGGTGLGLSISRELAKLLGGEIGLLSEEGKGSVFTLYLPEFPSPAAEQTAFAGVAVSQTVTIQAAPARDAGSDEPLASSPVEASAKDAGPAAADGKSLLIIEDDAAFAQVLADMAGERGFECILASTGEKGLELAADRRPSAIILDIGLPGIDGWEVMKALKADPATRHIPVHFMSAADRSLDAFKLGAIGYLTKPVSAASIEESFSRIERIISSTLKKILVVEDDPVQRKSIVELIGSGDSAITEAGSGAEALGLLREQTYDCIVLDLGLKDMSGFEVLSEIRRVEKAARTPIIVYTGRDLSPSEQRELERLSESIIIKGARSPERLLDETTLFLHRVDSAFPKGNRKPVMPSGRDLAGKKVLITDDDMRNVFALTAALEERGMTTYAARNGLEGIARLKEHPDTDIVLMDIMMPEMDGYEAIRAIRTEEKFRKLPIIALTAKAMKGDRAKCIEAGANDYLAKPVEMEKLLSLLTVWLQV